VSVLEVMASAICVRFIMKGQLRFSFNARLIGTFPDYPALDRPVVIYCNLNAKSTWIISIQKRKTCFLYSFSPLNLYYREHIFLSIIIIIIIIIITPDGVTLIPWSRGRCLTWDVTVPDTFAASHLPVTFLRQRLAVAVQLGNASCIIGTLKIGHHVMWHYVITVIVLNIAKWRCSSLYDVHNNMMMTIL